jgi:cytochrome c556
MRRSRLALGLAAALAIATTGATGAPAADKEQLLKDREALMKDQGRQWVAVRNYIQDKADQAAALAATASLIKSLPTVPNFFPPGSEGANPDGKYGPKPEVWSKHDEFLAADKKVADQVAALDAAIRSGDKAKATAEFADLKVCAACHDTFRAKLQ